MNGILVIGDVHLADKPPSGATEAYLDEQWAVMAEALDLAAKGDLVPVFAGDIFHSKLPSRNSHSLVRKCIGLCKGSPIQSRVVYGNHDVQHDNLSSLPNQPLGVVIAAGAMLSLNGQDSEYKFLYGVPWGGKVTPKSSGDLVVAHADIYPPGQVPPWGGTDAADWALQQVAGSCYYGHIHDWHGVYEAGNVTFANMGAITRGALTESERTRAPAVCSWDPAGGFGPYKLKSPLPAEEVLRIVETEEIKKQRADAEDFLAQLSMNTHTSLDEAIEEIRTSPDVAEHVRAMAIDLILANS